jgi:Ca2+-transporting ATPase
MNLISDAPPIELLSYLPGRARIQLTKTHLASLNKWQGFQGQLAAISGIHTVKTNPVTGRVLIIFDPKSTYNSSKQLVSLINKVLNGNLTLRPAKRLPQASWLGTIKGQAINVLAYGFIFVYSMVTRLFTGARGRTAVSPVFLVQSGVNLLSGYPFLRGIVGRCPRFGRLSGPLLVTTTSLVILTLTQNPIAALTGLVVSISSFTHVNISQKMIRRKTALLGGLAKVSRLEEEELTVREWLDLPGDLPELEHYARRISVIAFGVALVFVIMGNPLPGLAVLIVANPRATYTSATVSLAAVYEKLDSRGILINRYEAVPRLARIENIAFAAPGVLTAKFPAVTEIIVYQPGMTQKQVAVYTYSALRESNLPAAKALEAYIQAQGIRAIPNFTRKVTRGKGVSGFTEVAEVHVGSVGFLRNKKITIRAAQSDLAHFALLQQEVYGLAVNNALAGLIAFGSGSTPEAGKTLKKLRIMGFYAPQVRQDQCPTFLTEELELQPIDDVAPDNRTMLVTEAFNPAKRFEKAYISVTSSEADCQSRREADLILPGSWTEHIPFLLDYGRSLKEINRQNAILSGGTGLIGMMLILTGQISIFTAAAINELLNLVIAFNAKRLSGYVFKTTGTDQSYLPVGEETAAGRRTVTEYAVSCELRQELLFSELIQPRSWQNGLHDWEVAQRRAQFGPNQLSQRTPPGWIQLFFRQFNDLAALTLISAGGVAATMGHLVDSLTILAILVLNATLGASQEFKAERSMQAMRKITAPRARVLRDGMVKTIDATELVPGDYLLLESGDRVPADSLIIAGNGITVEEALLTGESEPVTKHPFPSFRDYNGVEDAMVGAYFDPNGLQDNNSLDSPYLLFMGTNVIRGRCTAVVTVTGMRTQMGQIMRMVDTGGEVTPIQSHYQQVNKFLVTASLLAAAVVSGVGIITGRGTPLQMIMTGLGMAVAAIPEGLPTIVNIALATGIQRLVKKGALVRRSAAMESLGNVDYICADKTGTITGNHLAIQEICLFGASLSVDQIGQISGNTDARWAITIGMLCNDATNDGKDRYTGDAVDVAFLEFGAKLDLKPQQLAADDQRIFSMPFESERRYMAIINKAKDGNLYLMVKGAPEKVLRCCSNYQSNNQILPLGQAALESFLHDCDLMASDAYRVIAVAYRREADVPSNLTDVAANYIEKNLVLVGLVGIIDPIRPGVAAAVSKCRQAGIKVVMITGDHPKTACAIAKSAGILDAHDAVLVGSQMDQLDEAQFAQIVGKIQVFARVKPAHKLRIVNTLRQAGHRIVMTGDGVNDAPAVKWADVGIAMGAGAEVTKEAAAIILVNDGFATIAQAIDEGRNINGNVKAAMEFLVAGNTGEVVMMALAVLSGVPLPLLPLHLLLVNLFTDGLPALGLALREPPRGQSTGPKSAVRNLDQDPRFYSRVTSRGLLTGATSLGVYLFSLRSGSGINQARSIAFASIVGCQFVQLTHWPAIGIRHANWLQNDPQLRKIILLSWGGLLASLYTPGLAAIFGFTPLALRNWLTVVVPVVAGAGVASYWEEQFDRHLIHLNQNNNEYLKGGKQICPVTEEVFFPD